jgi:hypothetical protein
MLCAAAVIVPRTGAVITGESLQTCGNFDARNPMSLPPLLLSLVRSTLIGNCVAAMSVCVISILMLPVIGEHLAVH